MFLVFGVEWLMSEAVSFKVGLTRSEVKYTILFLVV